MAQFQYIARSNDGRVVTGTMDASAQSAVVKQLREQGLIPTSIEQGGAASTKVAKKKAGKSGKIKLDDLVVFSRMFATMIRAGLPLIEVLNILADQSEKLTMKTVLHEIEKDVEAGSSLTEAMLKHPNAFNTFFVSMVKAGEAAGMLASILDQVASYLEKTASLQRQVKSAIMYPATVATIAMIITIFLLTVVVPVFEDIFKGLGGELPMITQIVLGISRFIQQQWYIVAGMIALSVFGFWQMNKTENGKRIIARAKMKLPIFGPLMLKVSIARFSRTLSTLIRSGVNILSALDIVAATSGNIIVEDAIMATRESIQSGESISKPLTDSQVFPPMVTRMIDVGERVGSLESMLSKIADFYEDQVDATVAGLTALIEPLLIVFLGLVIGVIVISMFMPLFTMIDHI